MRKQQYSIDELEVGSIIGGGVSSRVRHTFYLDPGSGSDGNYGNRIDRAVKTLPVAISRCETGKHDRIVLVESSSFLDLAADPSWSLKHSSLVGTSSGMQGQRNKIEQGSDYGVTTAYPMITVSGEGNLFANIYSVHGYSTTEVTLVGWNITGNYQVFKRCHLHGPYNTTLGANSGYIGVKVSGTGFQLFEECTFGNLSIARTGANANVVCASGTNVLFRDCIFYMFATGTTPYFVSILNTSGIGQWVFENCKFINCGTSTLTHAFQVSSGGKAIVIDSQCMFIGVAPGGVATTVGGVYVPCAVGLGATGANQSLIAINPS